MLWQYRKGTAAKVLDKTWAREPVVWQSLRGFVSLLSAHTVELERTS